jgi:hypothetical protein
MMCITTTAAIVRVIYLKISPDRNHSVPQITATIRSNYNTSIRLVSEGEFTRRVVMQTVKTGLGSRYESLKVFASHTDATKTGDCPEKVSISTSQLIPDNSLTAPPHHPNSIKRQHRQVLSIPYPPPSIQSSNVYSRLWPLISVPIRFYVCS